MATEFEKFKGGGAIIPPPPPFIEEDTFLFELENVFIIKGINHLILLPGIPKKGPPFRVGQAILILSPTGQETLTHISNVPMLNMGRDALSWPIGIPRLVKKEDIPIGSQVWAVKADSFE